MLGQRPWLLAAAVLALPLTGRGQIVPPAPTTGLPQLEGESFGSEDGGRVTVAKKARFVSGDAELSADFIRMDVAAGTIVAEGNVAYTTPKLRLLGERVRINAVTGLIEAEEVRVGRMPTYFYAERYTMLRGEQAMEGVLAWRNEPSNVGMALSADSIRHSAKTDRLNLSGVEPMLMGVPFFHLPHYGQQGYRELPIDIHLRARTSSTQGTYLQTTVTVADDGIFGRGLLLDAYSDSGFLVGPSFTYDNTKVAEKSMDWKSSLRAGYINDNSDLGSQPDEYGRFPDAQRHFILAQAVGNRADGFAVATQLQSVSDPRALPDFRARWYGEAQLPQSFAEISTPLYGGRGSLLIAAKTDDFQDVVQRLPEARWDLAETPFVNRRLRSRSFLSVARLSERPSEQLPGLDFLNETGSISAIEYTRVDGYAGLVQSGTASDWLSLRPVVGLRSTWWSESLNGEALGRTLGQVGIDAEMVATATWDIESAPWGIRGLRHSVRPFAGYRAYPEADGEITNVARLDRGDLNTLNLPLLDLADRRDVDTLTERQAAQLGVRNSLETRDANFGTREFLRADFFVDWREQRNGIGHDHSLYSHLAWKPASWLSLETLIRTSGESEDTTGAVTWATVHSGDLWSLSAGYADFRGGGNQNQFFTGYNLRLNSAFRLRLGAVYDFENQAFLERQALLIQKFAQSWELEYGVSERQTVRDGSDLGLTVRIRLFKF